MSIRDRLLAIKDNIHSVDIGDDKIYFKHIKGSQNNVIMSYKDMEQDAAIFALSACEEDGTQLFSLDELDVVLELPSKVIKAVVTAAILGDEKKPQGV